MRPNRSLSWCCSVLAVVAFASCKEELPPYEDPREVLKGTMTGRYVFHQSENAVAVYFTVVNAYDETLEAQAILQGDVEISLRRVEGVRRGLSISSADLIYVRNYDAVTGVLRLDAGDSLVFRVRWDFVDDQGRDLRETQFRYIPDPVCSTLRKIALEETFSLEGRVRIFDKVAPVQGGPVLFSLCHVSAWVSPQVCVSILPDEACNFLPR